MLAIKPDTHMLLGPLALYPLGSQGALKPDSICLPGLAEACCLPTGPWTWLQLWCSTAAHLPRSFPPPSAQAQARRCEPLLP